MAKLRDILAKGISTITPIAEEKESEKNESAIVELAERAFTTRNLVHFAHWTTNSYAQHMALGDLYEDIVDAVDEIVETYIGEFGPLSGLCCEACEMPNNIIDRIKEDAMWVKANYKNISQGSTTIQNLLDSLTGAYNKTLYKLQNLH